jgi:hypothetical protein
VELILKAIARGNVRPCFNPARLFVGADREFREGDEDLETHRKSPAQKPHVKVHSPHSGELSSGRANGANGSANKKKDRLLPRSPLA